MEVREILDLFVDPDSQHFELQDIDTTETIFSGTLKEFYEDFDEEEADQLLESRVWSIDNIGGIYGDRLILNVEYEA